MFSWKYISIIINNVPYILRLLTFRPQDYDNAWNQASIFFMISYCVEAITSQIAFSWLACLVTTEVKPLAEERTHQVSLIIL